MFVADDKRRVRMYIYISMGMPARSQPLVSVQAGGNPSAKEAILHREAFAEEGVIFSMEVPVITGHRDHLLSNCPLLLLGFLKKGGRKKYNT